MNHQEDYIEVIMRLPILYIDSGGIPEYCNGYGEIFDETNFNEKLEAIITNYDLHFENLKNTKRF